MTFSILQKTTKIYMDLMLSVWDRLFGRTRTERAENMAGNTWQLSEAFKRRDLPREKEGQFTILNRISGVVTRRRRIANTVVRNYKSVFDNDRHRFLEDLSLIDEQETKERNFVVCLSQRYEMETGDFYKLYLTDSIEKLKQQPENVFVSYCECDDFKFNGNKTDCKHIMLLEILKSNLIVEPPVAEPVEEPVEEPEPIADPESEPESEEELDDPEPRRRRQQKKKVPRALAGLTTTLKQSGISKRRRGRRNVKR